MARTLGSARHARLIELVVRAREAAGLTQAEVAGRLGRHQPFVSNIESGERRVDLVSCSIWPQSSAWICIKPLRNLPAFRRNSARGLHRSDARSLAGRSRLGDTFAGIRSMDAQPESLHLLRLEAES